jgi:hypothetical protein
METRATVAMYMAEVRFPYRTVRTGTRPSMETRATVVMHMAEVRFPYRPDYVSTCLGMENQAPNGFRKAFSPVVLH